MDRDQERRIESLKRQVAERAGEPLAAWTSEALPPDAQEAFWRRVLEFETAESSTEFQRLLDAGVELPAPDALDDERLAAKLWEVIHALARMHVFLSQTDHLNDRELYTLLWNDVLRQETEAMTDPLGAWHVDLVSTGSAENIRLYLKYYADDDARRFWQKDFPDDELPPHEDPPYDRDRHLPQWEDFVA